MREDPACTVRRGLFERAKPRRFSCARLCVRVRHAAEPNISGHAWLSDGRIYVSDMSDAQACAERVAHGVRRPFRQHCSGRWKRTILRPSAGQAIADDGAINRAHSRCAPAARTSAIPTIPRRSTSLSADACWTANPRTCASTLKNPDYALVDGDPRTGDAAYRPPGRRRRHADGNRQARRVCCLSGGIDSPVAGYMIARRGVRLIAVHFHSFPYTSERARDKVDRTGAHPFVRLLR